MSDVVNVAVRYVITDLDPVMQPDHIGAWVRMEDYKAQADRIEELEAELEYWREEADLGWDKAEERRIELAKAVNFIEDLTGCEWPYNEDAKRILAVLKGETDE